MSNADWDYRQLIEVKRDAATCTVGLADALDRLGFSSALMIGNAAILRSPIKTSHNQRFSRTRRGIVRASKQFADRILLFATMFWRVRDQNL